MQLSQLTVLCLTRLLGWSEGAKWDRMGWLVVAHARSWEM